MKKNIGRATLLGAVIIRIMAPAEHAYNGPAPGPIVFSVTVHATQPYTLRSPDDNGWPVDTQSNLSHGDLRFEYTRATPPIATDNTKMTGVAADFGSGNALVLLKNNNLTMDIESTPESGAVKFQVFRDVADSSAVGTGNFTLIPGSGQTPTRIKADKRGSFFLVGYVDDNPINGKYDAGEASAAIPIIIVEADLHLEDSQISASEASYYPKFDDNEHYIGGLYSSAHSTNALRLRAQLNLYGGGAEGKRGTDRVFAGWTQQVEKEDSVPHPYGVYTLGTTSRSVALIFSDNLPESEYFLPDDGQAPVEDFEQVPALSALPLLDSGFIPGQGNPYIVGTGGGTILVAEHKLESLTNQPSFGRRIEVTGVDSPEVSFEKHHRHDPLYLLSQIVVNFHFRSYLTLWTSPEAVPPDENGVIDTQPSDPNLPGERTYFDAYWYTWRCGATFNIDPNGIQLPGGITPFCEWKNQAEFSPIAPAHGPQRIHETRPPTGKAMIGFDARF